MPKECNSLIELVEKVSDEINGILRTNLYEVGLSEYDLENLKIKKGDLREALRNSGIGDDHAKKYVKQTIRNILTSKLIINPDDYNLYIPFDFPNRLSVREKFDILLYFFSLSDKEMALGRIIDEYIYDGDKSVYKEPCITREQIENLYDRLDIFYQEVIGWIYLFKEYIVNIKA